MNERKRSKRTNTEPYRFVKGAISLLFLGTLFFAPQQAKAQDYATWAGTHNITDPNADPDTDGVENLLEYVFATDPSQTSDSGWQVTATGSGQKLSLIRRKNMTDVNVGVTGAPSLKSSSWTTSIPVLSNEKITSLDATREQVTWDLDTSSNNQYFLKLTATQGSTNSAVMNIVVGVKESSVLLNWNPVLGATSYNIYWTDTLGGSTQVFSVGAPPYRVAGLSNGPWFFQIEPVFNGVPSGQLSTTVQGSPIPVTLESPNSLFPIPQVERTPYQRDFSDPMNPQIDWETFLSRHDLLWGSEPGATMSFPEQTVDIDLFGPIDYAPMEYDTELYLAGWVANGLIGAKVFKAYGASPWILRWDLGRMDVTTEIWPGAGQKAFRAFLGSVDMTVNSTVTGTKMRYDIWNAELRGTIETADGDIQFRTFVERDDDVVVIETTETGSPSYSFSINELPAYSPKQITNMKEGLVEPANQTPPTPVRSTSGNVNVITAELSSDGSGANAIAWRELPTAKGKEFFLSIGKTWQPNENNQSVINATAVAEAVGNVNSAVVTGLSGVETRHRTWWHDYLKQSYVDFPMDSRFEQYYWVQIARFANVARGDSNIPVDNNGPYMAMSAWAGTWWNLNIQTVYSPSFTANRMDVGKNIINVYRTWSSNNWWQSKSYPDSFTVERSSTYRYKAQHSDTRELGDLTWALYTYYRYWKYSADDTLVTGPDGLFEVLKKNCKYYQHVMGGFSDVNDPEGTWTTGVKGADGKWHLPKTRTPEYRDPVTSEEFFVDTNFSLQLYDWLLGALIEINDEFNLNDPDRSTWVSIKNDLTDFPVGPDGALEIAFGVDHERASRHNSHLISFYPLMSINPDQGAAEEDLFRKSVVDWIDRYPVTADYRLYSWAFAGCMFGTLGDGNRAYEMFLNMFNRRGMCANGVYLEDPWPVQESPFLWLDCIDWLLLQSWGDCIRVFPALPDQWETMAFTDLRAEGAFLVSAELENYRTQWIRIKSLAGKPCVIQTDITTFDITSDQGRTVTATQVTGPRGQVRWQLDIQKDETILLTNVGPDAFITGPENTDDYYTSDTIRFEGNATDRQGTGLTGSDLVWSSNVDGILGTGDVLDASNLSAGEHTITLTASDSQGNDSVDTLKMTIKAGNRPSLTDNLLVWYKFDETAGTTVTDSSGNGHHATCNAEPVWTTGRTGGAIDFQGKYVDMNNATSVFAGLNNEVTIAFWTLDDGIGSYSATRCPWEGTDSATNSIYLCFLPEAYHGSVVTMQSGANQNRFATTNDALWNYWIHWVYTRNSLTGESRIYKNGELYQSFPDPGGSLTGVDLFRLGLRINGNRPYTGIIDDFRIYSREFRSGDVKLLMNSAFANNQAPDSLALSSAIASAGAAYGTIVGTLSTTDPDAGETFTFALLNTANEMFAVQSNQVVVGQTLPTIGQHLITAVVTDLGGASFTNDFTISVQQNYAPTDISLNIATLPSSFGVGTEFATLSAVDPNAGDSVTFTLTDDASGRFQINGDQLAVASALSAGTYSITIKATDLGGLTYSEPMSVMVTTPPSYSFTPTSLSGCSIWLDATDLDGDGTMEGNGESGLSNGMVASWNDKSGNNRHATASGASAMPKLTVTATGDNLSTVKFDGADDRLDFPAITNIRTVFLILKDDDPNMSATSRFFLGHSTTWDFHRGTSYLFQGWTADNVKNGDVWLNQVDIGNGYTTDLPPATRALLTMRTLGNVEAERLGGDRNIADREWYGEFCEVIIYNRALNDTEVQQVENYLINKWSITP